MEIARLDELQLVQRCQDGSEAAFAELVRRHRPRLFTLAFRLTGDRDTAEDVVQETFVAAFRTIDRFVPRPSVAAWLNTIAVRNAGKVVAKGIARPRSSLDSMMDDDAGDRFAAAVATDVGDPQLAAEAAELRRELAAAISTLPFKLRAAVVTRYLLGLDYAEAAASLEMNLNTYKSNLLRGTRMLRELLGTAMERRTAAPAAPAATGAEPTQLPERPLPVLDQPTAAPVIAASTAFVPAVGPDRTRGRAFAEARRARSR